VHAQEADADARALVGEALTLWRELADVWGIAHALEGFALTCSTRRPDVAVRLFAVASCARQRVGIRRLPAREASVHAAQQACARVLGEAAFGAAWSLGCQAGLDSTIDEVLEITGD
jgi:hypothetical protein